MSLGIVFSAALISLCRMKQLFTGMIGIVIGCLPGIEQERAALLPDTMLTQSHEIEDTTGLAWKDYQDAVRKELLLHKENGVVKESLLQEMYIRNVVTVVGDSVLVSIPFNLHGPDCGAPDCYVTDVSFGWLLGVGDTLVFPEKLSFLEYEYGCIVQERVLKGTFELVEQTARHVIYHAPRQRRTLVLLGSNEIYGTTAYYFTDVGRHSINAKNIYDIINNYSRDNIGPAYPFTSWILSTSEYEHFLEK